MNSIILCKGSSDFVLLQYYMRTVYGWTDERTQNIRLDSIKRSRTLKKDENLLTIGGCGGCSKIIPEFEKILQRNSISAVGEAFDKVVIITDRDEVGTEEEFQKLKDFGIPWTIGDGDLWLFWCPWWHFIKNRLIMIIYIKRLTV